MPRISHILIGGVVLLSILSAAYALERFPPPEFETSYVRPTPTTPHPRQDVYQYVDTGVLILALALAGYLVLRRRSRRAILTLTIFSLLYFGFWRRGCICPVGSIQNVTLTLFDSTYVIPVTVLVFFLAPLVSALFFGRLFCAGVCPLGAIQDLVLIKPIAVPRWAEELLRLLAYLYLGLAVLFAATGSAFVVCRYDPFVAFFRLSGNFSIVVLGVCMLLIGLVIGRPYCRFLCPYGVILRQLSRLSKWRVTITPDECIHCRLCEDACPFGAIRKPTADWPRGEYRWGKRRLILLLLLLPILVAAGGLLGYSLGPATAGVHATVALAQRVYQEDAGEVAGTTDASDAFRATGRSTEDLYQEASQIRRRLAIGGIFLGGFMGFVVGGKLVKLSVRRGRTDYEAEQAGCLACGRCFEYCPREHVRRAKRRQKVEFR